MQTWDVHGQTMPKNANVICESSLIQYDNEIYLYLSVLVGFLMLSPMMHGRKIPGIIKKINKALFGKVIYPKYYKHSNEYYNLAFFEQSGHQCSTEIFFNFIKIPCYWKVSSHTFRCKKNTRLKFGCNLGFSLESWLKWNWDICHFKLNPHWHELWKQEKILIFSTI